MSNLNTYASNTVAGAYSDMPADRYGAMNMMWSQNGAKPEFERDDSWVLNQGKDIGFAEMLLDSYTGRGGAQASIRARGAAADFSRYGFPGSGGNDIGNRVGAIANGYTNDKSDGNYAIGSSAADANRNLANKRAIDRRAAQGDGTQTNKYNTKTKKDLRSGNTQNSKWKSSAADNSHRDDELNNEKNYLSGTSGKHSGAGRVYGAGYGANANAGAGDAGAANTNANDLTGELAGGGAEMLYATGIDTAATPNGGSYAGSDTGTGTSAGSGAGSADGYIANGSDEHDGAASDKSKALNQAASASSAPETSQLTDSISGSAYRRTAAAVAASANDSNYATKAGFEDMLSGITGAAVKLSVVNQKYGAVSSQAAGEGVAQTPGGLDGLSEASASDDGSADDLQAFEDGLGANALLETGAQAAEAAASGQENDSITDAVSRYGAQAANSGGTVQLGGETAADGEAASGGAIVTVQGTGGATGGAGYSTGAFAQNGNKQSGDLAAGSTGDAGTTRGAAASAAQTAAPASAAAPAVAPGAYGGNSMLGNLFHQNSAFSGSTGIGGQAFADRASGSAMVNYNLEFYETLAREAKIILSGDKYEFMMQLKPESLGKVAMRVVTENGSINAKFVVENEQAKAALEENLVNLKQTLAEQGLDVRGCMVEVRQGNEWSLERNGMPRENDRKRVSALRAGDETGIAAFDPGRRAFLRNQYFNEQSSIHFTA